MHAISEIVDHTGRLRDLYTHLSDVAPGMAGMQDCETLSPNLLNRRMLTEKCLVRHLLSIQETVQEGELANDLREPHSALLPILIPDQCDPRRQIQAPSPAHKCCTCCLCASRPPIVEIDGMLLWQFFNFHRILFL